MRVVNFAHGEFLMLGMYAAFWAFTLLHTDPYLTLALAVPLFLALGRLVAMQLQAVRAQRRHQLESIPSGQVSDDGHRQHFTPQLLNDTARELDFDLAPGCGHEVEAQQIGPRRDRAARVIQVSDAADLHVHVRDPAEKGA